MHFVLCLHVGTRSSNRLDHLDQRDDLPTGITVCLPRLEYLKPACFTVEAVTGLPNESESFVFMFSLWAPFVLQIRQVLRCSCDNHGSAVQSTQAATAIATAMAMATATATALWGFQVMLSQTVFDETQARHQNYVSE